MKKITIYPLLLLLQLGTIFTSCANFDEINTNPDTPTKATAPLLATSLILNITRTGGDKNFVYDDMLCKYIAWGEGLEAYQYNKLDKDYFSGYEILTNCTKMIEYATEQDKNAYEALAAFIKAYKLFYISMEVGDIPYSDALKGEEGNMKPRYDTQKNVMLSVLSDLEKSYLLFSSAKPFAGDPIFKGDIKLWKKTVTAFQLKVLMHLSKKESDTDLKPKERFAQLVKSGSLMTSNKDNFQLVYSDKASQVYPFHNTQTKHAGYTMISTTVIDVFKEYEDYRLFYYAKPAGAKIDSGIPANSWDAYIGVDPSEKFDNIKNYYSKNEYCALNNRYTNYPAGEPLIRLGYAEQNFILAEAVIRNWIQGDASVYYKKGIEASMNFIAENTPDDTLYHNGRKITKGVIDTYLNNSTIWLGADKNKNIEKIMTQLYLASFFQHPYDPYYNYRRTGYPLWPIDPNTNMNTDQKIIPLRWMYPQSEYSYNKENVEKAVARQFGGTDDFNKPMWIIQ